MKKYFSIWIVLLALCVQCSTNTNTDTRVQSVSSAEFKINKALVELVYITKDKDLVSRFKATRAVSNYNDPSFGELVKWEKRYSTITVDNAINKFLNIEFYGK